MLKTRHIIFFVILLPIVVLAQAATEVPPTDDIGLIVKALLDAVGKHNWPVVGVLVLVAMVYVLRKFGGRIFPWLKTSEGGTVLAMLTAISTALGGAALTGVPITGALVGTALTAGFAAIGAWTGARRLLRAALPFLSKTLPKVPYVGSALLKLAQLAAGADYAKEIKDATDAAYKPLDPAKTDGNAVANGLDQPPKVP